MTFEINYLVFSIIFLIIGVLVGYFIYSRLDKNKSDQNKDLETLKDEVEETFTKLLDDLNKKVESYHTKSDQDRGSLTQVLKDIRSIGSGVSSDINTFKNVLVSGGARTQGPWGQMVLETCTRTKNAVCVDCCNDKPPDSSFSVTILVF